MNKKTLITGTLIAFGLVMIAGMVRASVAWCEYRGYFKINIIRISGSMITTSEDILETSGLTRGMDARRISLSQIQRDIENYSYIKAATVSRQFPGKIDISVKERIPVCYLNGERVMLADNEGVILPIPKNYLRRDLPVITGYETLVSQLQPGMRISHNGLRKTVRLIDIMLCTTPELFSQISEFRFDAGTGEFTLYSILSGTPIFCGNEHLTDKLNVLAHFEYIMRGHRSIDDFQYLDLRWSDQVIAKERRS